MDSYIFQTHESTALFILFSILITIVAFFLGKNIIFNPKENRFVVEPTKKPTKKTIKKTQVKRKPTKKSTRKTNTKKTIKKTTKKSNT